MPDAPVQIVEIDEEQNHFQLNEEALAQVLAQVPADCKVSVVAVAGAFRTGKSFLLDLFLRYLRAGEAVTEGVRLPARCRLPQCLLAAAVLCHQPCNRSSSSPFSRRHACCH